MENSDAIEALLYQKAEELINSLTDEQKAYLEQQGIELELRNVLRVLEEKVRARFDEKDFQIEQLKEFLNQLTKQEIFNL